MAAGGGGGKFFLVFSHCFQVSFNYGHDNQGNEAVVKKLSGLDRDCFIIPVHSLDRFLPSGVPMPVGIAFFQCNTDFSICQLEVF